MDCTYLRGDRCDQFVDCMDASDEANCSNPSKLNFKLIVVPYYVHIGQLQDIRSIWSISPCQFIFCHSLTKKPFSFRAGSGGGGGGGGG